MTIRLKPEAPIRPMVAAAAALAPDQNALLSEGARVALLFKEGHLQEINFPEVGVLMMELCNMAYNGADSIQMISHFMATNEQKAWRNFCRHLAQIRSQALPPDEKTVRVKVGNSPKG